MRGFVHSSVRRSVGPSVMIELENVKTRISAPAHLSATGGRVSGLVVAILIVAPRYYRSDRCICIGIWCAAVLLMLFVLVTHAGLTSLELVGLVMLELA